MVGQIGKIGDKRENMNAKTILIIGTADTKSDELAFLRNKVLSQGAKVLLMDVGVLAKGNCHVDISNEEVAYASGSSLKAIRTLSNENAAMHKMADGASDIAMNLFASGRIHGMLSLGGTMGTDLAFDVADALPLGTPKVIVSTVAYSHLIPPERITPDLIMVLWAGGLYGLNSLCKSALAQAAGVVVGACNAAEPPRFDKPMVAITSLGKSCLNYMVTLKPALESRGFEVAVFHSTGMGGRAFEALAEQGKFACVLDLSLQELANHIGGSCVTSGASRLTGAGKSKTPQIVAPGAADMIDFPAWQAVPKNLQGRAVHVHNRLIASATSAPELRQEISKQIVQRLSQAEGPTHLIIPTKGVQGWDLPDQPLYDEPGLTAMVKQLELSASMVTNKKFSFSMSKTHINDDAFCSEVMAKFDEWVAQGIITKSSRV
jgi:uncharacterized protein (UPF0261 family)